MPAAPSRSHFDHTETFNASNGRPANALVFSPGGTMLAVTGHGVAEIFDVKRGASDAPLVSAKSSSKYPHNKDDVHSFAWKPGSSDLFATCTDKTVDFHDRRAKSTFSTANYGFDNRLQAIAWCGKDLVALDGRNYVYRLDPEKSKNLKPAEHGQTFGTGNIHHLVCTGQRTYFACDNGDVVMRIPPKLESARSYSVRAHTHACNSIAIDPQGSRLAVAGDDCTVSVWHQESLANLFVIDLFQHPVRHVAYSHDSMLLAAAHSKPSITITDAVSGYAYHHIPIKQPVKAMDWHPNHRLLAYSVGRSDDSKEDKNHSTPKFSIWGYPPKTLSSSAAL